MRTAGKLVTLMSGVGGWIARNRGVMKRLLLVLFVFLTFTAPALAQGEDVALRFYIVPVVQVGIYRSPAHFGGRSNPVDAELAGMTWGMMDYGLINVGMVGAQVNPTQITYLNGLTDIIVIPANIDNTIGANLATVKSKLAAFDIPNVSIQAADTYRLAMREVAGSFQFMQRLSAITGVNPTTLNIHLSTTYGQLNQTWKNALQQTASELGYSTAGINGSSTLEEILISIGNQNDAKTFQLGGISF